MKGVSLIRKNLVTLSFTWYSSRNNTGATREKIAEAQKGILMSEVNTDLRKTILVVDDVAMSLTAIRSILRDRYEVCISKSAKAATTVLERVGIDLILLDLEMPEVSGFEFLAQIQANPEWAKIPVICVTAHSRPSDIANAVDRGVKDYIVKPISAKLLLQKIEEVFNLMEVELSVGELLKRLATLEEFCMIGNSRRAEILIKNLRSTSYSTKTSISLEKIDWSINALEYDNAIDQIQKLVAIVSAENAAKAPVNNV
jgi:response regulator RpfG family c-di-GMP phosphodiesterase